MKRPTLKDVAQRAGVSVSTVSYALNDASTLPLATETKARVRRIAREIGYVPNTLARSLQSRSSRSIGVLLIKPLTTPRYAAITQGLGERLSERGYHLVLLHGRAAASCVDDVRGGRLDGLVFIGHDDHLVPEDLAASVAEHQAPFVTLDCGPDPQGIASSVDIDYAAGARQMIEHLDACGVTTVHVVRPDLRTRAERLREQGIAAALAERPHINAVTVDSGMTLPLLARFDEAPGEFTEHAARLAERIGRSLESGADAPERTAVLCSWGADAEVAYRAARLRHPGIRVGSLAAGVLSTSLWPGLSASQLPLVEAGHECADLIVAAGAGDPQPRQVVLAPALDPGLEP